MFTARIPFYWSKGQYNLLRLLKLTVTKSSPTYFALAFPVAFSGEKEEEMEQMFVLDHEVQLTGVQWYMREFRNRILRCRSTSSDASEKKRLLLQQPSRSKFGSFLHFIKIAKCVSLSTLLVAFVNSCSCPKIKRMEFSIK